MDRTGSILVASGVTVFTVAITDSLHIYVLLILGTTLLISAAYVERIAEAPLALWYIFRIPSMAPLLLALLLLYDNSLFYYKKTFIIVMPHKNIFITDLPQMRP
jgi:hypothetical protein